MSRCGACGTVARKRSRVVLVQGKRARAVWACAGCFRDSIAFLFVPELRAKEAKRAQVQRAAKPASVKTARKATSTIMAHIKGGRFS